MRLNRYLASCGLGSRRKCEALIEEGLVEVNGVNVTGPYVDIDVERDLVRVNEERVVPRAREIYLLLNKPKGYITTKDDPAARKTIMALLPKGAEGVFPIGRLDRDSEGLLLLTTDGALANRLAHPRYGVPRYYRVELAVPFPAQRLNELRKGIYDRGEHLSASRARLYGRKSKEKRVEVVLYTGKKRELRRLFTALGFPVTRILRYGFGPQRLGTLEPGESRPLSPQELGELKKVVDLGRS
jgi:23S rRNA pseudouridine2605 synthase